MKKLVAICTMIAFCAGSVSVLADNDKDDKDKGKKVPPGLAKKGGLPPGQAKKQGQAETPATGTAVAAPAATPAPAVATSSTAPAVTPAVAKPAEKQTDQSANTPAAKKPATFAEQKVKLDNHTQVINDASKRPRMKTIALQQISRETGVPVDRLEQQDKNHPEIGTTALLLGNLIAKQSGAKFGDLVAVRLKGKHWGDIAKNHNVDVGPLIQKASDVASVVRAAESASAR